MLCPGVPRDSSDDFHIILLSDGIPSSSIVIVIVDSHIIASRRSNYGVCEDFFANVIRIAVVVAHPQHSVDHHCRHARRE